MAKPKCIQSLVQVEHRVSLLSTLCSVVDEASSPDGPAWLHLVWTLVQDLENDLAAHGSEVRSC